MREQNRCRLRGKPLLRSLRSAWPLLVLPLPNKIWDWGLKSRGALRPAEVEVVAGFLGAGKTTFLRRLLAEADPGVRTVVLVNDFGALGVDGSLLTGRGADDAVESESSVDVITSPGAFESVKAALLASGFTPSHAEVTMEPSTTVALQGKDAESMLRVSDALEDLDDVQNVYANFDISEEEMARLAG